jgi:hypothetical protein
MRRLAVTTVSMPILRWLEWSSSFSNEQTPQILAKIVSEIWLVILLPTLSVKCLLLISWNVRASTPPQLSRSPAAVERNSPLSSFVVSSATPLGTESGLKGLPIKTRESEVSAFFRNNLVLLSWDSTNSSGAPARIPWTPPLVTLIVWASSS